MGSERTVHTSDGVDLRVRVSGPDDAPVSVVLVHGWTLDQHAWRYQVRGLRATLGPQVRVVRFDLRGHGRSGPAPSGTTRISTLARDLGDVVDAVAPAGPLVLVGHSMGGMTLMALAELRPELFADRVRGVVLISTSGGGLDRLRLGLTRRQQERIRRQAPGLLAARARHLNRRRGRGSPLVESLVVRHWLFGRPLRRADHRVVLDALVTTPATSMSGFLVDLMEHQRLHALRALEQVPVHVLVGARDRLTPRSHARRLAQAMPWAELTEVPDAGHMLMLERDRPVTAAITSLVTHARDDADGS
jgi:pimeloyl-ACP methyl ester carboxylesterase